MKNLNINELEKELKFKGFNELIKLYGYDYIIREYEDSPKYMIYEAIGLLYGVTDGGDRFIELSNDVLLNGISSEMTFDKIMRVMGKTRIFEDERYMVDYTQFYIRYSFGKYFIEASSDDKYGTNSKVRVALEDPKYKMRVSDNLDWEFTESGVWLIYCGKKYLLTNELEAIWWPVYYETDYIQQKIPETTQSVHVFHA